MSRQQIWERLGRIVSPDACGDWWSAYAAYPVAIAREDGCLDVYFSARDARSRSHLARVTVAIGETGAIALGDVEGPLLSPGPRGAFDADGVTVGCVMALGDKLLAYYLGWTVGVGVPFTNFIGLAVSDDGGRSFRKRGRAPILGRSEVNPFTLGYPWVMRLGADYRMWFGSHICWGPEGLQMEHVIKEAESANGYDWRPLDRVVVPLDRVRDPDEFAVSRPVVLVEPDGALSMWYARRHPGYSIGFAHSTDGGVHWSRDDEAVMFSGAPGSWEQTEQTYPCVFDHAGRRYMLYNGDRYGATGFGLARLKAL